MRIRRLVLLSATLATSVAPCAGAQTTYDACYVPSVGAVYLIKQSGLPPACLAPGHVAFSWISGGTLADGSVTLPKLAFDPATQAELDAVMVVLAAAGTINASLNPVDWTRLKNVPPGFADGVDNSTGTASDVVCAGCVQTADLADAAVAEAKLSFDPATQTELNAAVGRVSGYEILIASVTVAPGTRASVTVRCPIGKAAVGGGHFGQNLQLEGSQPTYGNGGSGSAWSVSFYNDRQSDIDGEAWVVCVNTF